MALRPAMAKWFEMLIAREELTSALQCLADTGKVELQAHGDGAPSALLPNLRAAVDEYGRLAGRYGAYWPQAAQSPAQRARAPEEIPSTALRQLRAWATEADPVIDRLQKMAAERTALRLLEGLLSRSGMVLPDLQIFARAGPVLASRAYLLPLAAGYVVPQPVLTQAMACAQGSYLLAVGPAAQVAGLDETLGARKATRIVPTADLPADRTAALEQTRGRIEALALESRELDSRLADLQRIHDLSRALADLRFIEWLVRNVAQLALTEHFAWITGWTSDLVGGCLQSALDQRQLHCLLRFPDAPGGMIRPVVLHNPAWARPFELFARLLGMPGATEVDPSRVLALVAPLMFGYMFADVGQGVVLVTAGAALHRRFPATALLIPGGIAAILFGLLFGSVFASEAVLQPLWLRPLERPLFILELSLVFGVLVVLLGLALDAVQQQWSDGAASWWAARAGLVLCYAGMVGTPFDGRALWALPLGLGWYLLGSAVIAPSNRLNRLASAAGEAVETLLQLAINTISFVRVGAFALAHAGLGSVVAGLAASLGTATGAAPAAWLMLAVGNALIIAIEGLVVGIQTTRLVLFEFFIRFLHGSGRQFRPLPAHSAYPGPRLSPRSS